MKCRSLRRRVLLSVGRLVLLCAAAAHGPAGQADDFPAPVNSQPAGQHPPAPQQMPALFDLPDGFRVTLFAGEPDVRQPIAFDFDDRGRIWVAENYTYNRLGDQDEAHRDRIVILHDTDGDGQHDTRRVFWDQGHMLTSLVRGFGGLWILNDGTLSFLPDANDDDVPDGEPVVLLDGWTREAGHNFVSGLMWGPDGWLYGRHGITETSWPGAPDVPVSERRPMSCGIWRFHPTEHRLEVVCEGTTNPWGLDYDLCGQMFFTNNVIGHLWHVIPGAHYQRMFGQDFNPHLYELLPATSDHYHWDHSGKWHQSRDGAAQELGGGHAHCGGMIYLGGRFPRQYHGRMFMCNIHGRCVNVDQLQRTGASYTARHTPDFLSVRTPWFRGVELRYGPQGHVYLSDWSDQGECHDRDGVHRSSGRIYRISYHGDETSSAQLSEPLFDGTRTPEQLVQLAVFGDRSGNEWYRRRARRRVLGQLWQSPDTTPVRAQVVAQWTPLSAGGDVSARLSALQLLSAAGELKRDVCVRLLSDPEEHIQAAAVRLGVDAGYFQSPGPDSSGAFSSTNPGDAEALLAALPGSSEFVRLAVASVLPQLDSRTRTLVGASLLATLSADSDRRLLLMTWYGICSETSPAAYLYMLGDSPPPLLLRFAARRIVSLHDQAGLVLGDLLTAPAAGDHDRVLSVLQGMQEGLQGQLHPQAPEGWSQIRRQLARRPHEEIRQRTRQLSVLFGDGAAREDLRRLVADRQGDHAARSQAVHALARQRDLPALEIFLNLLSDRAVYVDVASALASYEDDRIPWELLRRWRNLKHGSRAAAVETLCSRLSYGRELIAAIVDERIDAHDLTAAQVRQLRSFADSGINQVLDDYWGTVAESSEEKAQAIVRWKRLLTEEQLRAGDAGRGDRVFQKVCGTCHRLYGRGGRIGPDLTGANRNNLDYLLENIVSPGAVVPRQFTVSVVELKFGRVVNGVVTSETDQAVTLQTDRQLLTIPLAEIEERVLTRNSLMPDGLLDSLSEQQVVDLFCWLMKRQ